MSLITIDTMNGLTLEYVRVSTYCFLEGELGQILRSHSEGGEKTFTGTTHMRVCVLAPQAKFKAYWEGVVWVEFVSTSKLWVLPY